PSEDLLRPEVVGRGGEVGDEVARIEILIVARVDQEIGERCRRVCDITNLRLGQYPTDERINPGNPGLLPDVDGGLVRFVINEQDRAVSQNRLASALEKRG